MMRPTMTTERASAVDESASHRREYQLVGFIVGLIIGLLVVVPLAMTVT